MSSTDQLISVRRGGFREGAVAPSNDLGVGKLPVDFTKSLGDKSSSPAE